jgi:hypothetical protein
MVCMCAMGPEVKVEEVESSADKTVMKVTECPWWNRMKELGIADDLLTVPDEAFWAGFVKSLNPNIIIKHGMRMPLGDPYCEWIFEFKK